MSNAAGKGDRPRNCFSRNYRKNYDEINWGRKLSPEEEEKETKCPNKKRHTKIKNVTKCPNCHCKPSE